MIDIEGCAQRVAFMLACCGALAQTEEAIRSWWHTQRSPQGLRGFGGKNRRNCACRASQGPIWCRQSYRP